MEPDRTSYRPIRAIGLLLILEVVGLVALGAYEFTRVDWRRINPEVLPSQYVREVAAFALCHTVPLVEGRSREELRVLKMVLSRPEQLDPLVEALADYARRSGARRVAFRVQGEYADVYQRLIALGGRVRWTDLRMTVAGHAEGRPNGGVVLSNWEI